MEKSGQALRQVLEASDGLKRPAAYGAQRSKHEIDAAQIHIDHDGRHEPIVDVERSKSRCGPADGPALVYRGHRTDGGLRERRGHARETIAIDADIAVGEHDDVVARTSENVGEIGSLAVGASKRAIDDEPQVAMGQFPDQATHDLHGRVVLGVRTKNDLVGAPVLLAERAQAFIEARACSAHRLED